MVTIKLGPTARSRNSKVVIPTEINVLEDRTALAKFPDGDQAIFSSLEVLMRKLEIFYDEDITKRMYLP
jgi:hypothetical protein